MQQELFRGRGHTTERDAGHKGWAPEAKDPSAGRVACWSPSPLGPTPGRGQLTACLQVPVRALFRLWKHNGIKKASQNPQRQPAVTDEEPWTKAVVSRSQWEYFCLVSPSRVANAPPSLTSVSLHTCRYFPRITSKINYFIQKRCGPSYSASSFRKKPDNTALVLHVWVVLTSSGSPLSHFLLQEPCLSCANGPMT